nr:hypothetical protein [Tanacetum cinerariifolium]
RMIPEPGDAERDVNVTETFHEKTDDELSEKELKQIEADDQVIQTILLGLPEDIYAAIQDPLALMANSNNPYASPTPHQDLSLFNQNYMQQPMPYPEDITDPTTAMNMALALMAKAFKLNYSTPTNNNQRISSNPRNRQIAQPGDPDREVLVAETFHEQTDDELTKKEVKQMEADDQEIWLRVQQMMKGSDIGIQDKKAKLCNEWERNLNGYNAVQNVENQDLDEIKEVNANCILMANLQQVSTSGTRTDKAPVFDSDGSAENDSNVISTVLSVEQCGGTVEQNLATVEETHAYFESLYNNLAIEVEKDKLHDTIYENAKLRAQLFDKISEQKDKTKDNTAKTRRPQPRSNTKNDRVPSASKSSCSKNTEVEVEEHPRNLLLSKNKIHM